MQLKVGQRQKQVERPQFGILYSFAAWEQRYKRLGLGAFFAYQFTGQKCTLFLDFTTIMEIRQACKSLGCIYEYYEEIEHRVNNKCAYFVSSRQSGGGTGFRKAADWVLLHRLSLFSLQIWRSKHSCTGLEVGCIGEPDQRHWMTLDSNLETNKTIAIGCDFHFTYR